MRKMDEMEMNINLKSIKWSYFFTCIALFTWGTYDFIKRHQISPALNILIFQGIVYFFVSCIYKWKMGDDNGSKSILYYVIGVIFFTLLLGILLHYFPK